LKIFNRDHDRDRKTDPDRSNPDLEERESQQDFKAAENAQAFSCFVFSIVLFLAYTKVSLPVK
jgi:hypothetical protein